MVPAGQQHDHRVQQPPDLLHQEGGRRRGSGIEKEVERRSVRARLRSRCRLEEEEWEGVLDHGREIVLSGFNLISKSQMFKIIGSHLNAGRNRFSRHVQEAML